MRQVSTQEQQLGRKIKLARVEADMSQAQLGKAVFESQQMVSDWENGVVSPRAIALMRVAIALSKPLDYFQV
ncbi:helix-turn-helix domain-containing protein [Chroococcidiopsis sp.]|uniref:helix-turn-helix domain-containing protein n=1 Tax=Chroococcidiopsis sp. TaxID=3088168 RepID=UPI003F3A55AD